MYNNISKIRLYSMTEVILPYSEKPLNPENIDEKITTLSNHIAHLNSQLSQRKTHGGKGFRAKKSSLQNQISLATNRLNLLLKAQDLLLPEGRRSRDRHATERDIKDHG